MQTSVSQIRVSRNKSNRIQLYIKYYSLSFSLIVYHNIQNILRKYRRNRMAEKHWCELWNYFLFKTDFQTFL